MINVMKVMLKIVAKVMLKILSERVKNEIYRGGADYVARYIKKHYLEDKDNEISNERADNPAQTCADEKYDCNLSYWANDLKCKGWLVIILLYTYEKVGISMISLSDVFIFGLLIIAILLYLNDRKKITHKVTSFRTKVGKKRT